MAKTTTLKKRVYEFYNLHRVEGKPYTVKHFMDEGVPRRTIYRYLKDAEEGGLPIRRQGSGRKPIFNNSVVRFRLKQMFDHKRGKSLRKAAKKIGCCHKTISNILKSLKKPIYCFKRTKIPKRTPLQKLLARPKFRQMYLRYRRHIFVLDDESYFTLDNSALPGNDTFYSSDVNLTPSDVKNWEKPKFEPKLLVWTAMSPAGLANCFFVPSGTSIDQDVYLNECIIKRLMPSINKHHKRDKYIFWPDLATSHYANSVQTWLTTKKVNFVPKRINPANVPEARPIEDFWGIIKDDVYRDGWSAPDLVALRKRIQQSIKKFDLKRVQRLAASTIKRIDFFRRYGV